MKDAKKNVVTLKQFAEEVKNYFSVFEFPNAEISIQEVTKNNDTKYLGICVKNEDSNIAPTVYMEEFYKEYRDGEKEIEDCAHELASAIRSAFIEKTDIEWITDYEKCKELLQIAVCDTEANKFALNNMPHYEVCESLSAYLRIRLDKDTFKAGFGSIKVTNQLFEKWGVDIYEAFPQAMLNLEGIQGAKCVPMTQVLMELGGFHPSKTQEEFMTDESSFAYIVTNKDKVFGAGIIACNMLMDKIVNAIGDGFFVIPSSIHEAIIIPNDENVRIEELVDTIQMVNENSVEEKDVLSYNVFRYWYGEGVKLYKEGNRPV